MSYKDEYGILHISGADEVDGWTQAHVAECPKCRYQFSREKVPYTKEEWDAYVELRGIKPKIVYILRSLFEYVGRGVYALTCKQCGADIGDGNKLKHLEWHNKLGV